MKLRNVLKIALCTIGIGLAINGTLTLATDVSSRSGSVNEEVRDKCLESTKKYFKKKGMSEGKVKEATEIFIDLIEKGKSETYARAYAAYSIQDNIPFGTIDLVVDRYIKLLERSRDEELSMAYSRYIYYGFPGETAIKMAKESKKYVIAGENADDNIGRDMYTYYVVICEEPPTLALEMSNVCNRMVKSGENPVFAKVFARYSCKKDTSAAKEITNLYCETKDYLDSDEVINILMPWPTTDKDGNRTLSVVKRIGSKNQKASNRIELCGYRGNQERVIDAYSRYVALDGIEGLLAKRMASLYNRFDLVGKSQIYIDTFAYWKVIYKFPEAICKKAAYSYEKLVLKGKSREFADKYLEYSRKVIKTSSESNVLQGSAEETAYKMVEVYEKYKEILKGKRYADRCASFLLNSNIPIKKVEKMIDTYARYILLGKVSRYAYLCANYIALEKGEEGLECLEEYYNPMLVDVIYLDNKKEIPEELIKNIKMISESFTLRNKSFDFSSAFCRYVAIYGIQEPIAYEMAETFEGNIKKGGSRTEADKRAKEIYEKNNALFNEHFKKCMTEGKSMTYAKAFVHYYDVNREPIRMSRKLAEIYEKTCRKGEDEEFLFISTLRNKKGLIAKVEEVKKEYQLHGNPKISEIFAEYRVLEDQPYQIAERMAIAYLHEMDRCGDEKKADDYAHEIKNKIEREIKEIQDKCMKISNGNENFSYSAATFHVLDCIPLNVAKEMAKAYEEEYKLTGSIDQAVEKKNRLYETLYYCRQNSGFLRESEVFLDAYSIYYIINNEPRRIARELARAYEEEFNRSHDDFKAQEAADCKKKALNEKINKFIRINFKPGKSKVFLNAYAMYCILDNDPRPIARIEAEAYERSYFINRDANLADKVAGEKKAEILRRMEEIKSKYKLTKSPLFLDMMARYCIIDNIPEDISYRMAEAYEKEYLASGDRRKADISSKSIKNSYIF